MFTGEVARTLTPVQACIAKARLGATTLATRYGLANEGSFGPHPAYPWLTVDDELVALWDTEHAYAVLGRARSFQHMFRVQDGVATPEALTAFCAEVGFPEQGVLVRLADGSVHGKDVTVLDDLWPVFRRAYHEYGACTLETDLRAHRNPLRRHVIAQAGGGLFGAVGQELSGLRLARLGPGTPGSRRPVRRLRHSYRSPLCRRLVVPRLQSPGIRPSPSFFLPCGCRSVPQLQSLKRHATMLSL